MPTKEQTAHPAARRALDRLAELTADMRGGAILSDGGGVLACDGEAGAWAAPATKLLSLADSAGSEPAEQIHVSTPASEVFAVRHSGLVAILVTSRFTLSSLVGFDMLQTLREMAKAGDA